MIKSIHNPTGSNEYKEVLHLTLFNISTGFINLGIQRGFDGNIAVIAGGKEESAVGFVVASPGLAGIEDGGSFADVHRRSQADGTGTGWRRAKSLPFFTIERPLNSGCAGGGSLGAGQGGAWSTDLSCGGRRSTCLATTHGQYGSNQNEDNQNRPPYKPVGFGFWLDWDFNRSR